MPLTINLRHLEEDSIHLRGELPVEELDLDPRDEVIQVGPPLEYDMEVQKMEDGLLLQGRLRLKLQCECVRCLKPVEFPVELPHWTLHLPFQGEDAVVVNNDCVDLTPYLREDILLEFPQHPLCDPECRGLPKTLIGKPKKPSKADPTEANSSAWAELNKLKFKT
jgi:uncharacterized protein